MKDYRNSTIVAKNIAKLAANTWWIIHEGQNVGLWNKDKMGPVFSSKNQCFMMYDIKFFVDDKKKLPEDWEDLSVLEFDTEILNSPFKKIDGNDYTFRSYIQSYKAKGIILLGVEEGEEDHFISPNKEYAISVISPDSAWIKDKWDTFWHPDEIVDFKTHTNTIAISSKDYAKDVLKCKIIVPNADDKDFDDNKND